MIAKKWTRRGFLKAFGMTAVGVGMLRQAPLVEANTSATEWPVFRGDASHCAFAPGQGNLASPRIKWAFGTRDLVESSPVVADINNDGRLEVVVGSHDHNLYAVNGQTGAELWRFNTDDWVFGSPAIGDIDGDGVLEVVVGSHDNNVYALDGRNGQIKWVAETRTRVMSSPLIGDFDGDGQLEVVI